MGDLSQSPALSSFKTGQQILKVQFSSSHQMQYVMPFMFENSWNPAMNTETCHSMSHLHTRHPFKELQTNLKTAMEGWFREVDIIYFKPLQIYQCPLRSTRMAKRTNYANKSKKKTTKWMKFRKYLNLFNQCKASKARDPVPGRVLHTDFIFQPSPLCLIYNSLKHFQQTNTNDQSLPIKIIITF